MVTTYNGMNGQLAKIVKQASLARTTTLRQHCPALTVLNKIVGRANLGDGTSCLYRNQSSRDIQTGVHCVYGDVTHHCLHHHFLYLNYLSLFGFYNFLLCKLCFASEIMCNCVANYHQ